MAINRYAAAAGMTLIIFNLFFAFSDCRAEEAGSGFLQAVEFFSGYSQGDLECEDHYNIIPIMVDFDINLKKLVNVKNFYPPGLLQLQLEPFVSVVFAPDYDLEAGASLLLKLGIFPEAWALQPYIKCGIGPVYITRDAEEQGTHLNFIESYCAGAHYFFDKKTAFTLEGRFRHLSNAGMKEPNHGINSYTALGGVMFLF